MAAGDKHEAVLYIRKCYFRLVFVVFAVCLQPAVDFSHKRAAHSAVGEPPCSRKLELWIILNYIYGVRAAKAHSIFSL